MKNQLGKNMLWYSAGNLMYLFVQWLITFLVAKHGSYEDAGVLTLAISLSSVFQTVSYFGIRHYQVSDINNVFSDSTYFMFRGVTSAASAVLCAVFVLLNRYDAKQTLTIFLYMVFRIAESYSDVLHAMLQKRDRLDIAGKLFVIKTALITVVFMPVYFLTYSLNTAFAGVAAASVVSTVFADLILTRKRIGFRLTDSLKNSMSLASRTFPLCIQMFLFSAILSSTRYVLEKMTDETSFGIYSAISTPVAIIQAAAMYIYSPFIVSFARYHEERSYKKFNSLLLRILAVILILAALVLTAAGLWGEFALKILFEDSIAEHTDLLIPIIIGLFSYACLGFICSLEIVVRDLKGLIISCGAGLAVSAGATVFLVRSFGLNGASYGLVIGSTFAFILGVLFLLRKQKKESGSKRG